MRIYLLPSLIVFVFVVFACSLFIEETAPEKSSVIDVDWLNAGQVLGASESLVDFPPRGLDLSWYDDIRKENAKLYPRPQENYSDYVTEGDYTVTIKDCENGQDLFTKEAHKQVPIASITKLMTALVFLDLNPDLDLIYRIKPGDIINEGIVHVAPGELIRLQDLLAVSLIGSGNSATISLVRSTGMSDENYVNAMNKKARALGFSNTHFVDPIGLSRYNVSTASEVAELARVSMAINEIWSQMERREHIFYTATNKQKKVISTNWLLINPNSENSVHLGGKTGFIGAAGYCFVGKFTNNIGQEIITVVLGSDKINSRFTQARDLADWTYRNYIWK